jgi:hypothetical protein
LIWKPQGLLVQRHRTILPLLVLQQVPQTIHPLKELVLEYYHRHRTKMLHQQEQVQE